MPRAHIDNRFVDRRNAKAFAKPSTENQLSQPSSSAMCTRSGSSTAADEEHLEENEVHQPLVQQLRTRPDHVRMRTNRSGIFRAPKRPARMGTGFRDRSRDAPPPVRSESRKRTEEGNAAASGPAGTAAGRATSLKFPNVKQQLFRRRLTHVTHPQWTEFFLSLRCT